MPGLGPESTEAVATTGRHRPGAVTGTRSLSWRYTGQEQLIEPRGGGQRVRLTIVSLGPRVSQKT